MTGRTFPAETPDSGDGMTTDGPYRDGHVHVLAERCKTCIFRPGNLMRLEPGRVKGMVDGCLDDQTAITCHSTLYGPDVQPAICRGFYDRYPTRPLRLARALGLVVEVAAP